MRQATTSREPEPEPEPAFAAGDGAWAEVYRTEVVGAHFASAGRAAVNDGKGAAADGKQPTLAGASVVVRREPTNAHDPQALAVYLNEEIVGYLATWLAKVLSPLLDRGSLGLEARLARADDGWGAALARNRLPLDLRVVVGGCDDSRRMLVEELGKLRQPGGRAFDRDWWTHKLAHP